ncbi:hypothetical protein [Burkholderia sp. AU45388]|uniref:hypothetical protein n=1 Tax=Burkholderia sp. AU45388 TaxID=3059206 RepID=UPI00264E72BF|nr:hypothetical protein [Burkholderia sp. AU45388]MDN7427431.1 hypothetical protein [Burkholderia sp. AU45388]
MRWDDRVGRRVHFDAAVRVALRGLASSNGISATASGAGAPASVDECIAAGIDAQATATVNATRGSGAVASAGRATAIGVNAMVGHEGMAE